jgi:hypothetical protein
MIEMKLYFASYQLFWCVFISSGDKPEWYADEPHQINDYSLRNVSAVELAPWRLDFEKTETY